MRDAPLRLVVVSTLLSLAFGCRSVPEPSAAGGPPWSIEPLGPGRIGTSAIEDSVAFLPGGSVLVSRREGVWGEPGSEPCRVVAHGPEADGFPERAPLFPELPYADDPFVAPDGRRLVFVSRAADPTREDRDLWFSDRRSDGSWAPPAPFDAPINTPHVEMGPSLDRAGNLLFASTRPGGPGSGDLWLARRTETGYAAPVPLPVPVNEPTGEWNGLLAPDGDFIVFEASERATNVTPYGDLYVTFRDGAGGWSPPEPLRELNGPGSELNARITPDGRWLVFASSSREGHGNPSPLRVPLELLERYRPGAR